MNSLFSKINLNNYFNEPFQIREVFYFTKQQKIVGTIALALFSLIAVGYFLWHRPKKISVALIPGAPNISLSIAPQARTVEPALPSQPVMDLVGIPNLGSTCFINSVVMSLYPLKKHLAHLNSPVFKAIKETYEDPVLKAPHLVSVLREFYQKKSGRDCTGGGDSSLLIEMLLEEVVKEDPNLEALFCGFLKKFQCKSCGRKENGGEILTFYQKRNLSFSLDSYLSCGCRSVCGTLEDLKLPKYCFIDLAFGRIMVLEEHFEWKGIKFNVMAAIKGGSGHANCVIKKEDGNWYLFDDSAVSQVNPFGQAGYSFMILEKVTEN
ncbi:MAG: hypothetical protein H0V82_04220 [Candidatus Protochlamydia sp.]|nr:hypothetical protein [Candidatus Protochlamydia sp.]